MTPATQPKAEPVNQAMLIVIAFLLGEGPLEGVYFGEQREGAIGKYWWRRNLRAAIAAAEQAPQPITPEPVARLPSAEWTPCVKLPVTVHVRQQRVGETHVSTREGITPIKPDDLIMRGVSGEEYPIGRAIFEQTYRIGEHTPQPTPEPVNQMLLGALKKLACLGNGDKYGNSIGNQIAIAAIAAAEQAPQPAELTDAEIYAAIRPLYTSESVARNALEISIDEYRAVLAAQGAKK